MVSYGLLKVKKRYVSCFLLHVEILDTLFIAHNFKALKHSPIPWIVGRNYYF